MKRKLTSYLRKLPDKKFLKIMYFLKTKRILHLFPPKTFNEKIQWLKLYYRDSKLNVVVDKYEMKKYVSSIIGNEYIVPTYGIYNTPEDIKYDTLPDKFVLKCTHNSGGIIICKDKLLLDKQKANARMQEQLKINYYYIWKEWAYKNVRPRIICEKYLCTNYNDLYDYKFFCCNGKAVLVQVDFGRFTNHKRNIYSLNWELTNVQIEYKNDKTKIIDKPKKLEEMKYIAEKISKGFPFLRVDMYYVDEKIYVGELTIYHGAGFEKIKPYKYNIILGNMINLDSIGDKKL